MEGLKRSLTDSLIGILEQRNIGALCNLQRVAIAVGDIGETEICVAESGSSLGRCIANFTGKSQQLFFGIRKHMILLLEHLIEHTLIKTQLRLLAHEFFDTAVRHCQDLRS